MNRKDFNTLMKSYKAVREQRVSVGCSEDDIVFRLSIADAIIKKIEQQFFGCSTFELKNYYYHEDVADWVSEVRNSGCNDDCSLIYEGSFDYGASYISAVLKHMLSCSPFNNAWEECVAMTSVDAYSGVDLDSIVEDLEMIFSISLDEKQREEVRAFVENNEDCCTAIDEAASYVFRQIGIEGILEKYIPLGEDLNEEEHTNEWCTLVDELSSEVYMDFYGDEGHTEMLAIKNTILPQYYRWLKSENIDDKDRDVVDLIEQAVKDLAFDDVSDTSWFFLGDKAAYWFSAYMPFSYRRTSISETNISSVLAVYVVDVCLLYLEEKYHFMEGGVEAWAA